jgi:hypothetical protein
VRNIFDQYQHPENRLTHAFFTSLDRDRELLKDFLRLFVKTEHANAGSLEISVQAFPGTPELEENQVGGRGVPDAWVHNAEDWCLVVESKINAILSIDQVNRHVGVARSHGFSRVTALVITAHAEPLSLGDTAISTTWTRLYRWLNSHNGFWARECADYFETLEARMIVDDKFPSGILTEFTGFKFEKPTDFSYFEARRVLKLVTLPPGFIQF